MSTAKKKATTKKARVLTSTTSVQELKAQLAALKAESDKNKGRIQTIITRLNQAVGCIRNPQDPNDINAFLGQLRDLASDLQRSL